MQACVALACLMTACSIETLVSGGAADSGPTGDAARFDAPATDAPGTDAPMIDGGDAGPPRPTEGFTVATTGTFDGHPWVSWSGSEFVVGVVVATSAGNRIELFTMLAGDATPRNRRAITDDERDRRSVVVAATSEGRTGVAWYEHDGAELDVVVTVLPAMTTHRIDGVYDASDHPGAFIAWEGDTLVGIVRATNGTELYDATFAPTVRVGPVPVALAIANIQGVALRSTPEGAILSVGSAGQVYRHSTIWEPVHFEVTPMLQETAIARFADGSVLVLFTDTAAVTRRIHALRLDRIGGTWAPGFFLRDTGLLGPDPSTDTAGDHAVIAYVDERGGARAPFVASVDRDAAVAVGPCPLPSVLPVANDPSIACGAGWCAIVWIEATARDATDYVTRIIQLPAEPDLICP